MILDISIAPVLWITERIVEIAGARRNDAAQLTVTMQRLRSLALPATELASACAATIRVRLLKIAVAVLRNTRRIRLMYASHHPLRALFALAVARLGAAGPPR